jgi:hypothetical protein
MTMTVVAQIAAGGYMKSIEPEKKRIPYASLPCRNSYSLTISSC